MTDPANPLPLPLAEQEGRRRVLCRLCGRPLSGREARLWRLGEDCRRKLAERTAPRPGAFEVEQDGIPGL